jgi:hypothetical protein
MTLNPSLVTVGTINAGATNIQADVSQGLEPKGAVKVLLSTNYTLLCPPGWPNRPALTGKGPASLNFPGSVLASGSTFAFLAPEAAALVAAGAGTLA